MKYTAQQFKVTIIWFTEKGIGKRTFKKYQEAVEWAEKNSIDEVHIRITGKLTRPEKGELI